MNNEQTINSGSHGVKWGVIIGVAYAALVFLRYRLGVVNALVFSLLTFVGLLVVLFLLYYSGRRLRQENGGWIEMREAFKAMFIAVLIFEFFFMVMTLLYLKYVDPDFFGKLRDNTENMMIATKAPQSDIDRTLQMLEQAQTQTQYTRINVLDFLKTYLYTVGMTGLFALLFAYILKRKPPVFEKDNFFQS